MTATNQLRREIAIISHALISDKPKPQYVTYPADAFTVEQWHTLCIAEEVLTKHELNSNSRIDEYSEAEKQLILSAYEITREYHATHDPEPTEKRSFH